MATIASLDVALSANSARLKADLDKANKHTNSFAKKASAQAQSVVKAFKAIGLAVASISAAAMIGQLAQTAAATMKASQASGIAFESFQRLRFAVEQMGVAGEEAQKALIKINEVMLSAAGGSKDAQASLARLGLSYDKLNGMSPEEKFKAVIKGLEGITDAGERAVLAQKLLGEQFAVAKLDSSKIDEASSKLVVLSEHAGRVSLAFTEASALLTLNFQNIMTNALAPVIEYVTMAVDAFNQFAATNPVLLQWVAGLGLLATAILTVGAAFTVVGAIPMAIAAAIIAAISGIIYVTNNWDSIMRSLTAFLADVFGVSVDEVNSALAQMSDVFWHVVDAAAEVWSWIVAIGEDIQRIFISAIKTAITVWSELFGAIGALFTLDFAGFASKMMNAFTAVKDHFFNAFTGAIGTLGKYLWDMFKWALAMAAQVFADALVDGINWAINKLKEAVQGIKNFFGKISMSGTMPGTHGTVASDGGIPTVTVEDPDLGPTLGYINVGGGSMPSFPGLPSSPMGQTTGTPLSEAILPPLQQIAENTDPANTDDKGSGGGSSKADKKTQEESEKTAEKVSTAFMDHIKSSFADALATGDWKGFLDSVLDNFTMNIIKQFSDGLMDALFGDTFDNIFEKFGESVSGGLNKALSGAAGSGGGGGLFGGFFSWLGGLFGGAADGGIVPMTPYSKIGRDSVPMMLMPGELVVPVDEVGNFMNGGGRGGGVTNNINITGDISRQTKQEIYAMLPEISKGVNAYNHEVGGRG